MKVNKDGEEVEVPFAIGDIPELTDLSSIDIDNFNRILEDGIGKALSKFDWTNTLGFVPGLAGIIISLYADKWTPCIKLIVLIICVLIVAAAIFLPYRLRRKQSHVSKSVDIIKNEISFFQMNSKRLGDFLKAAIKANADSVEKAKQQEKDAKRTIKDITKAGRNYLD